MSAAAQIDYNSLLGDVAKSPGAIDDFKALSPIEKDKVLRSVNSDYAGLPPKERAKALDAIHYAGSGAERFQQGRAGAPTSTADTVWQTLTAPFRPEFWTQAARAGTSLAEGAVGMLAPERTGGPLSSLISPPPLHVPVPSDVRPDAAVQAAEEDLQRKREGRSGTYRATALVGSQLGIPARQMEEQADIGKPAGVVGAAAPITAATLAPSAIERGGPIVEGALESRRIARGAELGKKGLGIPAPPEAADLAGRGRPEAVNLARDFDIATKDLAKIERDNPVTAKGSQGTFQRAKNMLDYNEKLWEEAHNAPISRNVNIPIDQNALVDAARKAITPEALDAEKNPVAARKNAERWIDTALNKPRSLGSTDQFVRELNADLSSPRAQQSYGPLDVRMKQAALGAARSEIERVLTSVGETGVKDANQRYGAIKNLAERAIDQGLAEAKAEGKSSVLPDWIRTYVFAHTGGVSGGLSIHPSEFFQTPSSKQFGKGMSKLAASKLEPPPAPPSPMTPAPTTATAPLGPPRPPNYQPFQPDVTPIPAPPQAGFPSTGPVQSYPSFETPERSRSPQANLWNTNPTMARPGGLGGMPPSLEPSKGLVAQEFKKVGLTDLVTPRQSTTLETMMRGPRWRDMDRAERIAAIQAVLKGGRE